MTKTDVDNLIADYDPKLVTIIQKLRTVISSTDKRIEECVKFNIPFYTHCGMLLYLNVKKDHIVFGFVQGVELTDPDDFFDVKKKMVAHKYYYSVSEIKVTPLKKMIHKAVEFNRMKKGLD